VGFFNFFLFYGIFKKKTIIKTALKGREERVSLCFFYYYFFICGIIIKKKYLRSNYKEGIRGLCLDSGSDGVKLNNLQGHCIVLLGMTLNQSCIRENVVTGTFTHSS